MRQIRKNAFETNSSSTHSICICSGSDYQKFENGELIYNMWNCKFYTQDKLDELFKKSGCGDYDDWYKDVGYCTFEQFFEENDFETYEESFISPSGDLIVAFGYYGHD